jgi:RNA polymerase-binding transcription factor DksA
MSKKKVNSKKVDKKKKAVKGERMSVSKREAKGKKVAKKRISKASAIKKLAGKISRLKVGKEVQGVKKRAKAEIRISVKGGNVRRGGELESKSKLAKASAVAEGLRENRGSKVVTKEAPSDRGSKDYGDSEGKLILKPRSEPKKLEELSPFHRKQLERLEELRDHILDQMQNQEQITRQRAEGSEASAYGMHQADAGSDSYDRDFALSLLSQEQDALYEIEEAIKRIYYGTYGICEMSGKEIPRARLEAIPYARFTVECQAQIEKENKGRRRWDSTPVSFMESPDFVDQELEGNNADEESRRDRE